MKKEKTNNPTIKEVEMRPNTPLAIKRESDSIKKVAAEIEDLVLKRKADIEIKKDETGKKYAIAIHHGEIIHSTADPEEVALTEIFLKDPEGFLRKRQLEEVEEKFLDSTGNEILNQQLEKQKEGQEK